MTIAADELERRRCLLEARNRYHSEPDLVETVAASLDDHSTSRGSRQSKQHAQSVTVQRSDDYCIVRLQALRSMSVLVILQMKCTLTALRAVPGELC